MNADWVIPKPSLLRTTHKSAAMQRHPLWMRTALCFVALMIACAVFGLFDERTFNGVSVWSKPFKFSLSIAVYFATRHSRSATAA